MFKDPIFASSLQSLQEGNGGGFLTRSENHPKISDEQLQTLTFHEEEEEEEEEVVDQLTCS